MKSKLRVLLVLMLAFSLVLSGCAEVTTSDSQNQQTENENDQENSTTVAAGKTYKWTLATSWPSGLILQDMATQFAEEVKIASGGRLIVEVHPGGSIVGPLEVMDAANAGTIDAFHSTPGYWAGKAPASTLFMSVPMGFEPFMYLTWLYEKDGLELWQETYDKAGFNVKVIPLGITHPELLAHSHKPLESPEDFKGLKHRAAGDPAQIFKQMGVSVTTVPGSEVYPSLERNVIDSAEFSTPAVNNQLGFQEVTEYFSGPGMHQTACVFELTINKDSWNELPDDLKRAVEIAARSVTLSSWAHDFSESVKALKEFEKAGSKPVRVSDEVQREYRKLAWKFMDEKGQEHEMYGKVWNSIKAHYKEFVEYENFMVPIREGE
ncbi:MAG: TRAP transporter substrate-binding protein DctP [Bacillaceae bacterium]|nr:TRAP transporter substrate-binding protein DctP [Bacillaceae bacterium]